MSAKRIHLIGLGVAESAELCAQAKQALRGADVIIGSERQRATVAPLLGRDSVRHFDWPKLSALAALINGLEYSTLAVLASGDPLYYGIGRWFSRHFSADQLHFYPALSSIQVACHRLGIALQDVEVFSLHGRPVTSVRTGLKRNRQLLILTDSQSQPQRLAQECIDAGFSQSTISVCERLGYAEEKITRWKVIELAQSQQAFDPLHVTYIHVVGLGRHLPEFPGIADHDYVTDSEPGKGMISKREVRLAILSMMAVCAGDVVWDIGAGCGGVAVELALWQARAEVYALECHDQRLSCLRENRQRFGVSRNLHVIAGRAPQALVQLPAPDKVFIGGSGGELVALLDSVWRMLPDDGVLVASAVLDSTRQQLQTFARQLLSGQVESVELSVKRGHISDGTWQYVPKLPVEIVKFTKTAGAL